MYVRFTEWKLSMEVRTFDICPSGREIVLKDFNFMLGGAYKWNGVITYLKELTKIIQ